MGLFRKITSLFGTNEHKPNRNKRIEAPEFVYSPNLPEQLGIVMSVHSLNRLAARLEEALDDTYMNQVKDRVMSKHRYTAEKYNWMLLELKRYFILCSVLKNVPMYSNDTDVIWHEMLMFTRDYEDFCRKFTGDFIHHQPHTVQPSEAECESERAWYDLIYSRLFIIHPENEQLSSPFFKHPMEDEVLKRLEYDANDEVITSRLRATNDPDVKQLQEELLLTLSHQIREAHLHMDDLLRQDSLSAKNKQNTSPNLLRNNAAMDPILSILLVSAAASHLFEEAPPSEEELRKAQDTSGGGGYYGSHSNEHERSDSGHSNDTSPSDTSGGDSSCGGSSCGGGCSS
ncbi:hypothetical protein ACFQ3J_04635 [Paenibacillus provencensis]|uniref:DUF2935 domain-containing protein n=1 Tax=Paenibacillus provencensis TaxID=441151 RepID=A0ABW3PL20_9BACL|nr:hypothetical protein [Paenibacillus sp. MER 78]MCM3126943.1 hypothetical protein [Paenibacillus sp. MER 78]